MRRTLFECKPAAGAGLVAMLLCNWARAIAIVERAEAEVKSLALNAPLSAWQAAMFGDRLR